MAIRPTSLEHDYHMYESIAARYQDHGWNEVQAKAFTTAAGIMLRSTHHMVSKIKLNSPLLGPFLNQRSPIRGSLSYMSNDAQSILVHFVFYSSYPRKMGRAYLCHSAAALAQPHKMDFEFAQSLMQHSWPLYTGHAHSWCMVRHTRIHHSYSRIHQPYARIHQPHTRIYQLYSRNIRLPGPICLQGDRAPSTSPPSCPFRSSISATGSKSSLLRHIIQRQMAWLNLPSSLPSRLIWDPTLTTCSEPCLLRHFLQRTMAWHNLPSSLPSLLIWDSTSTTCSDLFLLRHFL